MTYVNQSLYEEMLSYLRPMGTGYEIAFLLLLQRALLTLDQDIEVDEFGNLWMEQGESQTLFVAHTDTAGSSEGYRKPLLEGGFYKSPDKRPLGADDTSGIYVLLTLIEAGVPGTYLFTRGEESGGLGAEFVARNLGDALKKFKRAIAFDRRGSSSVITHQAGGRCASDTFAEALSNQLNDLGLLYMPDNTGIYTDTAEFTELIPECTNISVGYVKEHSCEETQDWGFLQALAQAAVRVQWEELPTARNPGERKVHATLRGKVHTTLRGKEYPAWWDEVPQAEDDVAQAFVAWDLGDRGPMKEVLLSTLPEGERGMYRPLIDVDLLTQDDVDDAWYTEDFEDLLTKAWRH